MRRGKSSIILGPAGAFVALLVLIPAQAAEQYRSNGDNRAAFITTQRLGAKVQSDIVKYRVRDLRLRELRRCLVSKDEEASSRSGTLRRTVGGGAAR